MIVRILGYASSFIIVWLITWGLADLVGRVLPWAAAPLFWIGLVWWAWIGWVYVLRRERYEAKRRLSGRS